MEFQNQFVYKINILKQLKNFINEKILIYFVLPRAILDYKVLKITHEIQDKPG